MLKYSGISFTDKGGTSFADVGSDITLDGIGEEGGRLLGFWSVMGAVTGLAAKAQNARLQFISQDLGFNMKADAGISHGGDPATNIGNHVQKPVFHPCSRKVSNGDVIDILVREGLKGEHNNLSGYVAAVYETMAFDPQGNPFSNLPLSDMQIYCMTQPRIYPFCNNSNVDGQDTMVAVLEYNLDNTMKIPGRAHVLGGLRASVGPQAWEAQEAILYAIIESTQAGIEPQEIPLFGWSAGLGTAVGRGVNDVKIEMPLWVPLPKGDTTLTLSLGMVSTQATGSLAGNMSVHWLE